jgi:hypothetical protein
VCWHVRQPFYAALVAEAGIAVDIQRLCAAPNCNSHHIIEATFKAFARAMRAALDQLDARAEGPFVVRESSQPPPSPPQVPYFQCSSVGALPSRTKPPYAV